MAEQKNNALVLNGVNDDITELNSLTTLHKRLISDAEIVSKSANGFRIANGNTGVILRKGEKVSEGWLINAGKDLGSPLPSQIADKLRGRDFKNFKEFREAFWKEVANDPMLFKQFKGINQSGLRDGFSPYPPKSEQVGGREKYEIHHIKRIVDGGAVYDIDNLRILTPKRHIEIHTKKGA